MNLIRRVFGPRNSLILVFDPKNPEDADRLEADLKEVGRFYQWGRMETLLESKLRPSGLAVAVFLFPRKSFFLFALPVLRSLNIPFTLVLRPECTGLNRLPLEEELDAYLSHYATRISKEEATRLQEKLRLAPDEVDAALFGWRKTLGPLPVEKLDPTRFFSTWGKILELPPNLVDFGLWLGAVPRGDSELAAEMLFIQQQLQRLPIVGYSSSIDQNLNSPRQTPMDRWHKLGLRGVITPSVGAIERRTSTWQLPQWKLSEI